MQIRRQRRIRISKRITPPRREIKKNNCSAGPLTLREVTDKCPNDLILDSLGPVEPPAGVGRRIATRVGQTAGGAGGISDSLNNWIWGISFGQVEQPLHIISISTAP